MSSERQKAQARTQIIEILRSYKQDGCHHTILVNHLRAMHFPRRVYVSAIQSLHTSGQIVRISRGSSYHWCLVDPIIITA